MAVTHYRHQDARSISSGRIRLSAPAGLGRVGNPHG